MLKSDGFLGSIETLIIKRARKAADTEILRYTWLNVWQWRITSDHLGVFHVFLVVFFFKPNWPVFIFGLGLNWVSTSQCSYLAQPHCVSKEPGNAIHLKKRKKTSNIPAHIVVLCGFLLFFRRTVVFPFIGKTTPSSETSERAPSAKRDSLSSGEKNSSDSKATQVATRLHATLFLFKWNSSVRLHRTSKYKWRTRFLILGAIWGHHQTI